MEKPLNRWPINIVRWPNYVIIAISITLMACQDNKRAESVLNNYLYRLGNSLQVDQPQRQAPTSGLESYPSQRSLTYNIPSSNINLLQFLKLSSCELQRHIGQRNSSLGQFMLPSQQWFYEQRFLALAQQCLTQLKKGSELSVLLNDVIIAKQAQLPLVIWNATFASMEFSTLFSSTSQPLNVNAAAERPIELLNALDLLALSIKSTEKKGFTDRNRLSEKEIESAYAIIGSSKRVGELRHSMQLLTQQLLLANQLLSVRINVKPLCVQQQANKQFDIVQYVFMTFYIGEVQAYVAKIHQQAGTVLSALDNLLNVQSEHDELMNFWQDVYLSENSEWSVFNRAIDAHTRLWQRLLQQCGAMPS